MATKFYTDIDDDASLIGILEYGRLYDTIGNYLDSVDIGFGVCDSVEALEVTEDNGAITSREVKIKIKVEVI